MKATSNRRDGRRTRWDVPEQDGDLRDEAALVEAVRAGEAEAFDRLVGRYMRRAFAVAVRITGHRQDAEDVVQEAFLASLLKIDTFEPGRPFGPWLLRIVANRGINACKARALRSMEPIPAAAASRDGSPFDAVQQSELRDGLRRALAQLPDRQRWIVELFELDGFTSPEIAEMLDMAEGTVRWQLHQARQALRATLDRPGADSVNAYLRGSERLDRGEPVGGSAGADRVRPTLRPAGDSGVRRKVRSG